MKKPSLNQILLFFVLPLLSVLAYPPSTLANSLPLLGVVALSFLLLAVLLMRGSSRALTLAIFIQGMNVIIRIMMFFPHSTPRGALVNYPYMIITTAAILLSLYLVLRLDKADIRSQLVN
jgi:hypothetical protein